jgi:hypothetical protein
MTGGPAGALDGIMVLDLCSYLAGPYGCTLLADLGADVIKIESPQGDMLRQFPSSLPGESRFFLGTNRGKRALALDLKQPEGLAVLHRMVASADVLVENFRPSVPARLGIDYPRLRAINPRLVYAGLTGYGDEGPLSDKGGFDQVLQCLSGMAVFQGGGAEKPQLVLGSVLDYFTSALLAYGVAAALFQRERSGTGQYLSLSLLRSALTIQAGRFVWAESEGRDVARDSGTGGLTGIYSAWLDGTWLATIHPPRPAIRPETVRLCGAKGQSYERLRTATHRRVRPWSDRRETVMRLGISSYTYVWSVGVPGFPAPSQPLTPMGLLEKAVQLGVRVVQIADNLPLHRLTTTELDTLAGAAQSHLSDTEDKL